MKRSKTISKYNKSKLDGDNGKICPICGKHKIEVITEPVEYKLDGEVITVNEESFMCYDDTDIYATAEMMKHNQTELRKAIMSKENAKKSTDILKEIKNYGVN